MENVTTGHWIFAGLFMVAFTSYLIWSYRKDAKSHKIHYKGVYNVAAGIVIVLILFYVLKQWFEYYKS